MVQLLKGIFNSPPPKPRYPSTWDVSKGTSYLESLGPNEHLSSKQLSKKLVLLVSLNSAKMGSELVAHGLQFTRFQPSRTY